MKIHRFYLPDTELLDEITVIDESMVHQWTRVLRFRSGTELDVFNGHSDKRYEITSIKSDHVSLKYLRDNDVKLPSNEVMLLWSVLKKDKNEWVLQKATELGVSVFVPLLADRSEKTGFNLDRAQKIVIEASEQCGRGNVPTIHEVMSVTDAIDNFGDQYQLFICEQGSGHNITALNKLGVLIGPEGGWSDKEKDYFTKAGIDHLALSDFTLRAETAAVASVMRLVAGTIN